MKTCITAASAAALSIGLLTDMPAVADPFSFSTGNPDGKLAALSRRPSAGNIETETADDFVLTVPTVISRAVIHGLIPLGTPLSGITQVEIEVYHIFPKDSNTTRAITVPTRNNSPSDVEIDAATRDSSHKTLGFSATLESPSFTVANTVVNGIHPAPIQFTGGEGPATGEEVEIDITFTPPIFLPTEHYFFRPEAQVTGGNFLYLSAPDPIVPPGTPFMPDLQAWIRNSNLAPDWLRIGTDITHQGPFNMTYSLAGETIPGAGTPGIPNCRGTTVSAMAHQFGGIKQAAVTLGYSSVRVLQNSITAFCSNGGRNKRR
ncbi:MAG TPA: hypothetical protein VIE66_03360 [Methylocella sp.]|jgi:hypothetical protein